VDFGAGVPGKVNGTRATEGGYGGYTLGRSWFSTDRSVVFAGLSRGRGEYLEVWVGRASPAGDICQSHGPIT